MNDTRNPLNETGVSRRNVLRGTAAGLVGISFAGLLASCDASPGSNGTTGKTKLGGILRVGISGGSARDTIDAHDPNSHADVARLIQLYEPLAQQNADYKMEMVLAESIEPGIKADEWTIRLKAGIVFHDGKPLTADDLIYSLRRITDPKNPRVGAASLADVDPEALTKVDGRTVRLKLKRENAAFLSLLGQYFNVIVPVGYDPKRPVGTGPFKYKSFTAGEQSEFVKNESYWRKGEPFVDSVVIINISDPEARVSALMAGQVDAIDDLPTSKIKAIESRSDLRVLEAETGNWTPFTMRVDSAPFSNVDVRQAFRLLVNREEMITQALGGHGDVGNDLFGRFDPAYAKDLPQRQYDPDQARSLLKRAGQSDLSVELVTAPVAGGVVELAQVFAQQAQKVGVTVNVRKLDVGTFYGDDYLRWGLSQDYWTTRDYLAQVAQSMTPGSPFNQTHWDDAEYLRLYGEALKALKPNTRNEIIHEMQKIEWDRGGYIIPAFGRQLDACSKKLTGYVPAKTGRPLSNYCFRQFAFEG